MDIIKIFKRTYANISSNVQNMYRPMIDIDDYVMQTHVVSKVHNKTFSKYKNINYGKDVAIIATGPSLNKYVPIKNTINIGVNKAFLFDKIKLNYYFAQDYSAVKEYIETIVNYSDVQKFYGVLPQNFFFLKELHLSRSIIPESLRIRHNAQKYFLYSKYPQHKNLKFNADIDSFWLTDGGTVVMSALQFALYTNPNRIYLIGCDCSCGHFDEDKGNDFSCMISSWKELKNFANIYYPDTEIISVNPVGLKGLFTDLYQE